MRGMRLEPRGSTPGHRMAARLAIATSIGGALFALCVIPNAANDKFHRWIGPLAGVTFIGPVATAFACRSCVDERASYNDGYNDALMKISTPSHQEVQYVQNSIQAPEQVLSNVTELPLTRPSFSGRISQKQNTVAVMDSSGDEFAFLDASA
jgi:hypothetical protein